jgi:hypothetical protein
MAFYASALIASCLLLISDTILHWFLVPLLFCGTLVGVDCVDWARGKLGLFDPIGIVGLTAYYGLFIAPMLVAVAEYQLAYLPSQPADYRPWLGLSAVLNCAGWMSYRFVRSRIGNRVAARLAYRTWTLDTKRSFTVLTIALATTGLAQLWVYIEFGGLSGYIDAYVASIMGQPTFQNKGWLFAISESFPILLVMGYALYPLSPERRRSWVLICGVAAAFFFLQWVFGGLRGSRSNFIWNIFWALGIFHFRIRRLPRWIVFASIPPFLAFMYFYGFYKDRGLEALELLKSAEDAQYMTETTNRTLPALLISDLSRADVQAFLVSRLAASEFNYALGQSYLGAITLLIPRRIWEERLPTKQRWTSAAEYDSTGESGSLVSSRVYGLAGEAMLNFGFLGVPVAFAAFGAAVGLIRRIMATLPLADIRWLFIPLLVNFCPLLLTSDSDNNVVFLLKYGLAPFVVIFVISNRVTLQALRRRPVRS